MSTGVSGTQEGRTTGGGMGSADMARSTDRPSAYIPGDRRRAIAAGTTLPSRVRGSALFADISGFTPLTEALAEELGSQRASEVLTGHLNRVFHAVIAELDRHGGEVIYFSGDAITCWLDGDDGARAAACGLAMQAAIARERRRSRRREGGCCSSRSRLPWRSARHGRFVVGDPEIQLIDVLAGGIVDRLAEAEHHAEAGEVVLDPSALDSLSGRVELVESRAGEEGISVGVLGRLTGELLEAAARSPTRSLPDELARPWLLPAVYERLSTGRGEFLAELRPAYPMFVSFGGIDYDEDESASEKLDEFVRAAQRVLSDLGGNVLQLTLGDKGAYLYGVFGTPFAHEDDARSRLCRGARARRPSRAPTAARDIRIGITHGRLRSGTYGHARRRTFVLPRRRRQPGRQADVEGSGRRRSSSPSSSGGAPARASPGRELEPLQLKGKAAPVAAYPLTRVVGAPLTACAPLPRCRSSVGRTSSPPLDARPRGVR